MQETQDTSTEATTEETTVNSLVTGSNQSTTETTSTDNVTDGATNWKDSLPDDLKGYKGLEKFNTSDDVLKSYIELEKGMGNKSKLPDEHSTPEEIKAFYNKLGTPESIDGYDYDWGEDSTQIDEESYNNIKALALENNITGKSFNFMMDAYKGEIARGEELLSAQHEAKYTESVETLKNDWGSNFQSNMDDANEVINRFGFAQTLVEKGLDVDADVIKMFAEISRYSDEGSIESGNTRQSSSTTADAQKEYSDIVVKLAGMNHYDREAKPLQARKNELANIIFNH